MWKLKTWRRHWMPHQSMLVCKKQEFANSKVSWRNCSFTFHHIWDVLWRKFRYRYILIILYPEELFRYDMLKVFWYVKLSFLTYRFRHRPARSNSASWRVCWRGGGFGSGTTCLGFSLRHQSRRQGDKAKTNNHCAIVCHCAIGKPAINQWNIFPHAEVDMVVAHLLHKVRVSEEGLTIRRAKSMRFRQNLTKQANAEKHCFPPYSKRVQWCTLMINDVEWD